MRLNIPTTLESILNDFSYDSGVLNFVRYTSFFGANQIEWSLLPTLNEKAWLPIIASRLPRPVALILTGSGLAMCGVILQHIAIIRTVMLSATADF
ncbi:iron chelate uptake ABC transporter family permease subunit [Vibrio fortis]|uniref:iron chelate uptake ABC transporter family permease subunit n=1 Tax=Vibrio fortis TaxID=212667 RepID=UPI001CDA237C